MTSMCISAHFKQFLAKCFFLVLDPHPTTWGLGLENDLSVQIWPFHFIPRKKHFLETDPNPHPEPKGMDFGIMIFLCNSVHFIQS